jgi:hypothetical protein
MVAFELRRWTRQESLRMVLVWLVEVGSGMVCGVLGNADGNLCSQCCDLIISNALLLRAPNDQQLQLPILGCILGAPMALVDTDEESLG